MTSPLWRGVLAAAFVAATGLVAASAAPPPNAKKIVQKRQQTMKHQAADAGAIKAYLTGKADHAKAEAAATALSKSLASLPELFPPDTALPSPDGKFKAKPEIWSEWSKFLAVQKSAAAKGKTLEAAVKSGDKAKITAAFADLGKNGCGACHQTFREKLTD